MMDDKDPSTPISQKFSEKKGQGKERLVKVGFFTLLRSKFGRSHYVGPLKHFSSPTTNPANKDTMKRKLDENNEPAPKESKPAGTENGAKKPSFTDFGLDPRLVQAIAQEQYREPTLVQAKAIPLGLEGKDVLAKAKTGSGKTAAYVLPVLQAILKRKQVRTAMTCPTDLSQEFDL